MSRHVPRVSIGLPVYNGEDFLAETLESLLGQTYEDFELIISDNGSTDRTPKICRRYAARDPRIRYLRHEENRGTNWNFNHAFEVSRGEYFKWAAHDDLCHREFLARAIRVLDRDPSVVWCHCETLPVDEQGQVVDVRANPESPAADTVACYTDPSPFPCGCGRDSHDPARRFRAVLLGRRWCVDLFGLIRARALKKTRLFLPAFAPEKVLVAELSLMGRYHEIPEPLFFLRVHAGQASLLCGRERVGRCGLSRAGLGAARQLRLLSGYVSAVWQVPLSPLVRCRCLLAVARYVLQVSKWKRMLRYTLPARAFVPGTQKALEPSPRPADRARAAIRQ